MVRIINLTPHAITLQREDGSRETFPPSGQQARVETKSIAEGMLLGAPVVRQAVGPVSGLPSPEAEVIHVVSALVAQRTPTRDDVVAPDTGPTAVRDEGQVVAVRGWVTYA